MWPSPALVMQWKFNTFLVVAALAPALSLCIAQELSSYGTLDAQPLPRFLDESKTGYPWGSEQPGRGIPDTGVTRYYNLSVSRAVRAPDGVNKSVILINNQFPGPLIEANWGDTIVVTAYNNIEHVAEGLTLHWHGQPGRTTPGQDGTPGITQCPIPPGGSLTYKIRAESFGTGWYHSHVSGQYGDGLYGPMVVYGPTTRGYDVDIGPVMLSLHVYQSYLTIMENIWKPTEILPIFNTNLINGRAIFNCSVNPHKGCNPYAGLSKFKFQKNKTHLLRLINTGSDGTQKFTIDDHDFTVIANDYVPVQPYNTKVVTLGVGQRADVLVKGTGSGAYWMRSDIDVFCLNVTMDNNHALAAIYYEDADTSTLPKTKATKWGSNNCANDALSLTKPFYPYKPSASKPATDVLNVTLQLNSTGQLNFFTNGSSFYANFNEPILRDVLRGKSSFPKKRKVYDYGNKTSIRLIIYTSYSAVHPMHLHGHDFWILAQGYGEWDGRIHGDPNNPQRRDTQLFLRPSPNGPPSYTVIQWDTDNPGVWPLHCHTSVHVSAGLLINVVERSDLLHRTPEPSIIADSCAAWSKWSAKNKVNQIDSGER